MEVGMFGRMENDAEMLNLKALMVLVFYFSFSLTKPKKCPALVS